MRKLTALFLTSSLLFVGCGEEQPTEEQLTESLKSKNSPEAKETKKEDKTTDEKIESLEKKITTLETEISDANTEETVQVLEEAIEAVEDEIAEVAEEAVEVIPPTFSAYSNSNTFLGKFFETLENTGDKKIHKLEVTDVTANNPLNLKFAAYVNEDTGKLISRSGGDANGVKCAFTLSDCQLNCYALGHDYESVTRMKNTLMSIADRVVTIRDIPYIGITARSYYDENEQCINIPEGREFMWAIKADPYYGDFLNIEAPVLIEQD